MFAQAAFSQRIYNSRHLAQHSFMPPAFSVPQYKRQCIHIYRSLLRECTYLPDQIAREQISRQVKLRFRSRVSRGTALLHKAQQDEHAQDGSDAPEKLERMLKPGQRALETLKRANGGGRLSLRKILFHAYGRTGKRRYELIEPLLQPETPSGANNKQETTSETGPTMSQTSNRTSEWTIATVPVNAIFEAPKAVSGDTATWRISKELGPLNALLKSQIRMKLPTTMKNALKRAEVNVPTTNSWGRSMPRKRVKNAINKEYATIMDKILPLLPPEEWNRLRDLSNGTLEWEGPVSRRARRFQKPAILSEPETQEMVAKRQSSSISDNVQIGSFTTRGFLEQSPPGARLSTRTVMPFHQTRSWLDDPKLLEEAAHDLLEEEVSPVGRFKTNRNRKDFPRTLNSNNMRRIFNKVLSECPQITQHPSNKGWIVHWENPKPDVEICPESIAPLFDILKSSRGS